MEFLAILLLTLTGLVSPAGFVADRLAEEALQQRLESAEKLVVRVDNAPSYRLVQGRVQRVRVAGEGLVPLEGVRIAALNLEAEGVALDPGALQDGRVRWEEPLEAGVQVVLTEEDLNRALQSPMIAAWLQEASLQLPGSAAVGMERYDLVNPRVDLLEGDRLRFQVTLEERRSRRRVPIDLESGFTVTGGRLVRLVQPTVNVDGVPVPAELLFSFTQGPVLDLQQVGGGEILLRLLQLEVEEDQMAIAAWVRIEPEASP